jgi:hypothetical protein
MLLLGNLDCPRRFCRSLGMSGVSQILRNDSSTQASPVKLGISEILWCSFWAVEKD